MKKLLATITLSAAALLLLPACGGNGCKPCARKSDKKVEEHHETKETKSSCSPCKKTIKYDKEEYSI